MTNQPPPFPRIQLAFILGIFSFLTCSCTDPTDSVNEQNQPQGNGKKPILFRILILGESLTEGYGVSDDEAYPTLLEEKLNAELSPKTKLRYKVVNGGISGATTSGGVSRIEWFLQAKPDYLLVALGGNDGLRGIPVEEMKKNIDRILKAARQNEIPTMLAGMKIPPNYGESYATSFSEAFEELAEEHEVPLIPFLLEGVGGNSRMNLPDRIHPNPLGHQVLCQTVYENLVPALD
jgi:acyl-CoA thioesterase-1